MKIQDLLNSPSSPSSRSDEGQSPSTSPYSPAGTSPSTSTSTSPSSSPSTPPPKKIKLVKDAPVFNSDAQPRGAINFPPYEADEGSELAAQHERFCVQPKGRIAEFVRHIPYASDKKGFSEKTGREGFDVYQYTFRMPGESQDRTVMWDYTNGLVRITPFFKCLKYSKTIPAKVLNMNHGLRDLSHSITGGALAAQGYWMPYHCARAVASTFCYTIRHALTPIFGPSFPSDCTHPSDPAYGRMIIDKSIIRNAAEEAREMRQATSSRFATPPSTPAIIHSARTSPAKTPTRGRPKLRMIRSATPSTPSKPLAPKPAPLTNSTFSNPHLNRMQWTLASAFHPKTKTLRQPRDSNASEYEAIEMESEHGTDDSDVPVSPKTRPEDLRRVKSGGGGGWTAVNGMSSGATYRDQTPSPWLSSVPTSPSPKKRALRDMDDSPTPAYSGLATPYSSDVDASCSEHTAKKQRGLLTTSREARAALMLLKLRNGDVGMSPCLRDQSEGAEGGKMVAGKEMGRDRRRRSTV